MRGNRASAHKVVPTETQGFFAGLSRHRRVKLAKAANTTLVKADQWAGGRTTAGDVAHALENAVGAFKAKK